MENVGEAGIKEAWRGRYRGKWLAELSRGGNIRKEGLGCYLGNEGTGRKGNEAEGRNNIIGRGGRSEETGKMKSKAKGKWQ